MSDRRPVLPCLPVVAAWATLALLLVAPRAAAQSSASFRIDEAVLNAGGDPTDGVVLTSSSFIVALDALGEPLVGSSPAGPSFRLDGGLVASLRPTGETRNLRFESGIDLRWDPEPAAAGYRVYRGSVATLPGSSGNCIAAPAAGAGAADPGQPAPGQAWTYLVTAHDRLNEEGTPGSRSDGSARPAGAPCP